LSVVKWDWTIGERRDRGAIYALRANRPVQVIRILEMYGRIYEANASNPPYDDTKMPKNQAKSSK
jgi:hypothetical protein